MTKLVDSLDRMAAIRGKGMAAALVTDVKDGKPNAALWLQVMQADWQTLQAVRATLADYAATLESHSWRAAAAEVRETLARVGLGEGPRR